MRETVSMDERERLITAHVTLNERPAHVRGRLPAYPSVISLDRELQGEWSWDAVSRIVARDGKFKL